MQHVSAAVTCIIARPTIAAADDVATAPVRLSRSQIDAKLSKVPVVALVNEDDAPFLTNGRIGYFFLDPSEAFLSLQVLKKKSPEARLKVVT